MTAPATITVDGKDWTIAHSACYLAGTFPAGPAYELRRFGCVELAVFADVRGLTIYNPYPCGTSYYEAPVEVAEAAIAAHREKVGDK